jgi:hypothetical protein
VIARTLPLLNGKSTNALGSTYTTCELPRWLDRAIVAITIESVLGAPSAMSITPKFEMWHSVAFGGEFERLVGTSAPPPWFGITASTNKWLLPDGDWVPFTNVSPGASGISQAKTIRGGFPWRVRIDSSFTGGTSPSAKISMIAYVLEATG